jgi:hypothetical protein
MAKLRQYTSVQQLSKFRFILAQCPRCFRQQRVGVHKIRRGMCGSEVTLAEGASRAYSYRTTLSLATSERVCK